MGFYNTNTIEEKRVNKLTCPTYYIEDKPRFAHRSFMLDEVTRIRHTMVQTSIVDMLDISFQPETKEIKGSVSFSGTQSVGASLKRLEIGGSLNTVELLRICKLLETAGRVKQYSRGDERPEGTRDSLDDFFDALEPCFPLSSEIRRCILTEEEIADDASGNLKSIRRQMKQLNDKVHSTLNSLLNGSARNYLQDAVITMRNGRYCVPVKAEYKGEVQGIVHDTSSTGATLFIEPIEIVDANNKLKKLELDEIAETERILTEISGHIAEVAESMIENIKILSSLDIIFAKGKLSLEINGIKPAITKDGIINLVKARHPLIDAKKVVPIDISVGDEFDTLVITGPNTGGKTVSLKTIGLFVLLIQTGILLPCKDGSSISCFDEIYADIGDEQSIEQSLSTFSGHMKNIVEIVKRVNKKSLVLFDELGAGTDPIEGAALAIAILDYVKSKGAKTVATTHYSELKLYAMSGDRIENASCEFDVESLRPTYRLQIGIPGKSNAFAISKKLGLFDEIIDSAERNISSDNIKFEDVISELEEKRLQAEKEHISAKSLNKQASEYKSNLESERVKFDKRKQKIIDDAIDEAKNIISRTEDEVDRMLAEIIELRKQKKNSEAADKLEQLKSELKSKSKKLNKKRTYVETSYPGTAPESVIPGTSVYIVKTDTNGTVISQDKKGNVLVQTGILKVTVSLKDIRVIDKDDAKDAVDKYIRTTSSISKTLNLSPELDLRGLYADEAVAKTEKFVNDATMSSLKTITVVHGKGTGALRKAIHDFLSTHPYVKSYRLGNYGEGDHGVTVIELV